ncbi:hypothetical protein GCM10011391_01350 [Pullulanibacillus camelliae]|uniref:Peptidase M48 domain-containing protein n=1 Tax=Pullulanibacillus camelliae TaxID=1707096 RepID=A0A8J2YET4_9BACL|nr:M48 family metalloprotease [Pullulanibacillus camelliae]GGE26755.1 hypothetical protein GCM10011391_01350 [Pullulanibacillus camelliae]
MALLWKLILFLGPAIEKVKKKERIIIFHWFEQLSTFEATIWVICTGLVDVFYVIGLKSYIHRVSNKLASIERTLKHVRIWNERVYLMLFLLVSFLIATIIMAQVHPLFWDIPYESLFDILSIFFVFWAVGLLNKMILFTTRRRLRGKPLKRREAFVEALPFLGLFFIPIEGITALFELADNGVFGYFFRGDLGEIILYFIVLFLIFCCLPLLITKLFKTKPLTDSDLTHRLHLLVEQAGVKRVKLYSLRLRGRRTANALVTGVRTKRILISEDLLTHLNARQIEAIVAHEIGHIKSFHIIKRFIVILLFFPYFGAIIYLLYRYEVYIQQNLSSALITFIIIAAAVIYGLLLLYVCRFQEQQADLYTLKLGVDYRELSSALLKLARLNHMPIKRKRVLGWVRLHPSIAQRVWALIHSVGGSMQDVEKYEHNEAIE